MLGNQKQVIAKSFKVLSLLGIISLGMGLFGGAQAAAPVPQPIKSISLFDLDGMIRSQFNIQDRNDQKPKVKNLKPTDRPHRIFDFADSKTAFVKHFHVNDEGVYFKIKF